MSKVTVVAVLKAKPEHLERTKAELEKMVEETQKENGCINYDLHEKLDEPGTFLFHENWESQEALDKHMQTKHFEHLTSIADEILSEPPQIGLYGTVKCSKTVASK